MNSVGVAERLAGYYANANAETITQRAIWAEGTRAMWCNSPSLRRVRGCDAHQRGHRHERRPGCRRKRGVVGYKPQPPESQKYYDHGGCLQEVENGISIDRTITVVLIGSGDGRCLRECR